MAKRFSDSNKWSKPFIRKMKSTYKLLWLYLLDECNHAGIWQVDFEVAQLKIGEKLNLEQALQSFGGKVIPIDGGEKWFIPDFIEFQYGKLKENNRVHYSVIQTLNTYGLLDDQLNIKIKGLTSPLQGAKDMDKDKEKDKTKDKVKGVEEKISHPFSENFLVSWDRWKDYKSKQHLFKYKSIDSEQLAVEDLVKLSGGSEDKAVEIILHAIKKSWKGLYEIKTEKIITFNGKNTSNSERPRIAASGGFGKL